MSDSETMEAEIAESARHERLRQEHLLAARNIATKDPEELDAFIGACKERGLRGYKGEFVSSAGTRIACEFGFERERRREDD